MAQAATPTDVDTLNRVLSGIPIMSHAISDPARHEKIITYIDSVCKNSPQTVALLVNDMNAFSILSSCIRHPLDDRITSLALRLIGRLIASAAVSERNDLELFPRLLDQHPLVLEFILDSSLVPSSTQDTVPHSTVEIFGCLETLRLMLFDDHAIQWMVKEHTRLVAFIMQSLRDQNLFVVRSCSQLIVGIVCIERQTMAVVHHELMAALAVSGEIEHVLREMSLSSADSDEKLTVLDLIWMLVESKNLNAMQFIINGDMVYSCFTMLLDTDRLVQHRAADVLKLLFTTSVVDSSSFLPDSNPKRASILDYIVEEVLVSIVEQQPHAKTCYIYFSVLEIISRIRDNAIERQLATAAIECTYLSLIECNFSARYDSDSPDMEYPIKGGTAEVLIKLCTQTTNSILKSCTVGSLKQQTSSKGMVVHAMVTMLRHLNGSSVSPENILKWTIGSISSEYLMPKTLISGLHTLYSVLDSNSSLSTLHSFVWTGIQYLFEPGTSTQHSSQMHKAMLDLVLVLLRSSKVIREMDDFVLAWFHEILSFGSWEIQDITLDCIIKIIGALPLDRATALFYNSVYITKDIAACLLRESPFLRSTALNCLNTMAGVAAFRQEIDSDTSLSKLILRMMTTDSEAFVRRAAIGLVATLSKDVRYCHQLCEVGFVTHDVLEKCCFDEDLEVRIQAIQLIVAWFGSPDEALVLDHSYKYIFFHLDADKLVLAMTRDSSRLVRLHLVDAIDGFLKNRMSIEATAAGNRTHHFRNRLDAFMNELSGLNLVDMRLRCAPEYLYQEALDMDASVLLETDDAGSGNNVLHCYDC
ncbi:hypothetical protein BASA61_001362 [Batrachochytrium salamandrivorans]|nr:hypothetical protein BASA61_001362 [Batrachochytrium salamandrivorans]